MPTTPPLPELPPLLPCPFCGCKAVWFKTGRDIGIECEDGFDCPGRAQTNVYEPEHREDVIAEWNRRVLPTGEDIRDIAYVEADRRSSAQLVGYVGSHGEIIASTQYQGETLKQGDAVYVLAAPVATPTEPAARAQGAGEAMQILGEEIGAYGLLCATKGELAPYRSLVDAMNAVASLLAAPTIPQPAATAGKAEGEAMARKMVAICCGRSECGGECGREWLGEEPVVEQGDVGVATAARFARLYAIVRRIRWEQYGVAHVAAGTDSAAAMGELCEFLFADGIDAAISRDPSLADPSHPPIAAPAGDPEWMDAFDEARDAILRDRHALAEEGMTNDQTNAVLTILDDAFMPLLKRATPTPKG